MTIVIMSFVAVSITAFLAAGLTLYSGFGLGTLLLPVFALFFPVEVAVVATALVHGANNVFKVALLGRHADREVVIRFGLPAIVAASAGAALLGWMASAGSPSAAAQAAGAESATPPLQVVIGSLMIVFALFDMLPQFRRLQFPRRYLPLGGILSGFFGGLSGHQGALRSAFLAKAGLDTQRFVGSNAVIGLLVDFTRLVVYAVLAFTAGSRLALFSGWPLVLAGALAAFCGVLVGKQFLHKVTIRSIQVVVGALLLLIGLALIAGWL